jgi:hypothetical protein
MRLSIPNGASRIRLVVFSITRPADANRRWSASSLVASVSLCDPQGEEMPGFHPVRRPALGALALLPVAALLFGCGGSDDPEPGTRAPQVACASIAGKTYANVDVAAAVAVPASGAIPGYCKVTGTEAGTEHDIEVRLPDEWRKRLVQEGGGGFDGRIAPVNPGGNVPLSLGAVQVANNGGHRDPSGAVLLNNAQVVQRYAHTAIITANRFGKQVSAEYYGETPSRNYYQGCSNGGRGALNAAAKYGVEFDGVIAGAPTRNLTGQIEQWTRAAALTLPSASKLNAVAAAAVSKCDALDGASDGIVSNWRACNFDPSVDVPAAAGLTADEASAVKTLMADLQLSDGSTLYSGFGFGDMAAWGAAYAALGVGHVRNIVLNDPTWSPASFDIDTFFPIIQDVVEGTYHFSAASSGLAQFLQAGKKVMVWHGSDDALLSHKDTIRTWTEVTELAGTTASANSRLYIAPGVNHCGGGPGADRFDLLTPLVAWVEEGKAPDVPVARKVDAQSGATLFSRPLCVHPQFPKYRGTGDLNSAESYICSES